jgi:hypothetical protein
MINTTTTSKPIIDPRPSSSSAVVSRYRRYIGDDAPGTIRDSRHFAQAVAAKAMLLEK